MKSRYRSSERPFGPDMLRFRRVRRVRRVRLNSPSRADYRRGDRSARASRRGVVRRRLEEVVDEVLERRHGVVVASPLVASINFVGALYCHARCSTRFTSLTRRPFARSLPLRGDNCPLSARGRCGYVIAIGARRQLIATSRSSLVPTKESVALVQRGQGRDLAPPPGLCFGTPLRPGVACCLLA